MKKTVWGKELESEVVTELEAEGSDGGIRRSRAFLRHLHHHFLRKTAGVAGNLGGADVKGKGCDNHAADIAADACAALIEQLALQPIKVEAMPSYAVRIVQTLLASQREYRMTILGSGEWNMQVESYAQWTAAQWKPSADGWAIKMLREAVASSGLSERDVDIFWTIADAHGVGKDLSPLYEMLAEKYALKRDRPRLIFFEARQRIARRVKSMLKQCSPAQRAEFDKLAGTSSEAG